MVTGISSAPIDEYGTTPDTPSLDSIEIVFNANKVAYLYLNKEDVDISPYQITLAVDANEINDDQIKVGVAKSDAINWEDYWSPSQPVVEHDGKIFSPIRFVETTSEYAPSTPVALLLSYPITGNNSIALLISESPGNPGAVVDFSNPEHPKNIDTIDINAKT